MADPQWIRLACFVAGVLAAALYGLTAGAHFPAEARVAKFKAGSGLLVLWSTLLATGAATTAMLAIASWTLPWQLALLGGGAMLLFAPMLLQLLPDSFVDGRRGLIAFSAGSVALDGLMWALA